jgi:hypothetical protein
VVSAGVSDFKGPVPEAVSALMSESPEGFVTATVVGTRVIALEAVFPARPDLLEVAVLPGVAWVRCTWD